MKIQTKSPSDTQAWHLEVVLCICLRIEISWAVPFIVHHVSNIVGLRETKICMILIDLIEYISANCLTNYYYTPLFSYCPFSHHQAAALSLK